MIRMSNRLVCAVTGFALLVTITSADVITKWTFDSSNTVATVGAGAAALVGGTTLNGWPAGSNSVASWSTTSYPVSNQLSKTAGVMFQVSTVGYTNTLVSFDWMPSSTASSNGLFQYSTDGGGNWSDWPSTNSLVDGTAWASRNYLSFNLTNDSAVANCPGFCFRFVSVFKAGATAYAAAGGGGSTNYKTSGTWRFDDVMVSGTLLVALSLTSTNAIVSNDTTTCLLQGVQTNVAGAITWSNTLNAATGTATVNGNAWSATVPLDVGNNVLVVSAAGVASKSVTVTRRALFLPVIAITSPATNVLTVANTTTAYDLAGTSSNLVGSIGWTNALTAAAGTLPAAAAWSIAGISLSVGGNALTVSGTNAAGNSASAVVTVTRLVPPSLAITNPAAAVWAVDADTSNFTLAGTSGALVGNIQWTNALTGAAGITTGATHWSIPDLVLSSGTNTIAVSANGGALYASVQLVRLPPAADLKSGDLALVGWDDTQNSNRFSFLTLANIPSGSVVYFTDNGWSNTQFRGASANGGDGNETLLKFLAVQALPAGTLVRLVDANSAVEWIRGDTIPGGGTTKFKDLVLSASGGDQICVFQGPAANPLWSPTVHLFVLDDSGAFEDALDVNTGNIPPGLIAGKTALTFAQSGPSQHVMAFTNFDGQARNKGQWLAAIANSNNWVFGGSGELPTNTVIVAPPPLLTLQTVPANAGTASGAGRYDADAVVTLTAAPLPGWTFVRWNDGNTNASRTLTMSTADVLVTAFFTWRSTLVLLQ